MYNCINSILYIVGILFVSMNSFYSINKNNTITLKQVSFYDLFDLCILVLNYFFIYFFFHIVLFPLLVNDHFVEYFIPFQNYGISSLVACIICIVLSSFMLLPFQKNLRLWKEIKHNKYPLLFSVYTLILVIPFLYVAHSYHVNTYVFNQIYIISFILFYTFINFILFTYISNIKIRKKEIIVNLNTMNIESTVNNYQKQYEQTQKLRHDLKDKMAILSILLNENKIEEAKSYLEKEWELTSFLLPNQSFSGNIYLDAYLNAIINKNRNLVFDFEIADLKICTIDTSDLVSLVANLLNNAIEALITQNETNYPIKLKIAYIPNCLIFKCSNYSKHNPINHLNTTSKYDYLNHGYGITIIEDIVEKYEGFSNYEYENFNFCFYITLNIK